MIQDNIGELILSNTLELTEAYFIYVQIDIVKSC